MGAFGADEQCVVLIGVNTRAFRAGRQGRRCDLPRFAFCVTKKENRRETPDMTQSITRFLTTAAFITTLGMSAPAFANDLTDSVADDYDYVFKRKKRPRALPLNLKSSALTSQSALAMIGSKRRSWQMSAKSERTSAVTALWL